MTLSDAKASFPSEPFVYVSAEYSRGTMVFLRQLRRLLRRDGTVKMHPRKKRDEQVVLQHMDGLLHERNITSKRYHVKVSVAT